MSVNQERSPEEQASREIINELSAGLAKAAYAEIHRKVRNVVTRYLKASMSAATVFERTEESLMIDSAAHLVMQIAERSEAANKEQDSHAVLAYELLAATITYEVEKFHREWLEEQEEKKAAKAYAESN